MSSCHADDINLAFISRFKRFIASSWVAWN